VAPVVEVAVAHITSPSTEDFYFVGANPDSAAWVHDVVTRCGISVDHKALRNMGKGNRFLF